MSEVYKIPFLRFLLPFLGGVLLQYYFYINRWSIIVVLLGTTMMFLSFFIVKRQQFTYRWLFGFGLYLVLLSFGLYLTWIRQYQNTFPFSEANKVYNGYIANLPQDKPNTIALEIQLEEYGRKIICYLPKDSLSSTLDAGDKISFMGRILPFEQVGQIGHFDYANYMFNKNYCGYTFIQEDLWEKDSGYKWTLAIAAAKARKQIITFYRKLDLSDDEFALLAGLTIGYTTSLSDDVIQNFRDSGVAHILAVSGLHVGIVYFVILSLLKPISSRRNKEIIVVFLLWTYVFIVGLPPSAVRAAIMLSIFSFAKIRYQKVYTYNSIFLAAFIILVWNPLSFFDVGFQMSFVSILSIKLFMPALKSLLDIKNKLIYAIWNLSTLSLSAQIGLLPLTLYYFGTFPVYFLFANLLIVPVVSIIIYFILAISLAFCLKELFGSIFPRIIDVLNYGCQVLLNYIIETAHIFAKIPYSSVHNIDIPLITVFLLWGVIVLIYLLYKKLKASRFNLLVICCLSLIAIACYKKYIAINTFTIYKTPAKITMVYQCNLDKKTIIGAERNKMFYLNGQKLLLLVNDNYSDKDQVIDRMKIDYLYIEVDKATSILELATLFDIQKVVLGNCLSSKTMRRLMQECEKKGIPYYDIYTKGNLTINF